MSMNNGQYPPSTERRQRTVLKELSSPVTNESLFHSSGSDMCGNHWRGRPRAMVSKNAGLLDA
jgi:hypothetical protein